MKKLLLFLLLGYAVNINAQLMNLIYPDKSSSYYCTKGVKKVFFKSPRTLIKNTPMPVPTKANEFIVVSEEYGKDKQSIFWGNKKLVNGDIATFDWNSKAELPFDKDFMYEEAPDKDKLIPINDMDKDSYERVKLSAECLIWHKDINYYYYNHKRTSANRQKLSFESEYLPFDDVYIFIVNGKDWEPFRYTGKVRVIANNIVHDDKWLIISGVCGESRSKSKKIEIGNTTELISNIVDKSLEMSYSDLIFKTSKYIYYKGKYLYLSKEEDITDLSQFKELCKDHYRYINKVYYAEKELTELLGADANTFELSIRGYSKDANKVYHKGKTLANSDAKTFTIHLRSDYESDANNIYKEGEIISTDAENFRFYPDGYSKDETKAYFRYKEIKDADATTFRYIGAQYAKDKNKVYFQGRTVGGVDAKTYQVLPNEYAKDCFKAYFRSEEIKDADPVTFEYIADHYAKDKNRVYFRGRVIPKADPATLEHIPDSHYAKDKNYVYDYGELLEGYEPKKFVKDKCGRYPDHGSYGKKCPVSSKGWGWGGDDD